MNKNSEKGIAIILALIMLLVMSIMAISASFLSNTDFQGMAIFKRGQESFMAADSCIIEARKRLETIGYAELRNQIELSKTYLFQGSADLSQGNPFFETVEVDLDVGNARCRSGTRVIDQTPGFVFSEIGERDLYRVPADTSLQSGGSAVTTVAQLAVNATGKDSQDEDIDDDNLQINTGVEVLYGLEVLVIGGDSNIQGGGT